MQGSSGNFTYRDFVGCSPLTVRFTANTKSRTSFVWDFNDGTTIITADSIITHTYTVPGLYVPKMIVRDASGCAVPITGPDTIVANDIKAGFTADMLLLCSNGTVTFTNNTVSNDVIKSYALDFGDGAGSSLASPAHFYSAEGRYKVKLEAITATGYIESITAVMSVKVVCTPYVSITQSPDGCVPLTKTFTGNLLNADTSAISWSWQAGNGSTASSQIMNAILFTSAGNYSIQLTATNSCGCKDTAQVTFNAYPIPLVRAGMDLTICKGTPGTLTASGAASYTWSPVAGLSCTACASPDASPLQETSYTVTGTSAQGSVSKDTVKVSVQHLSGHIGRVSW